MRNFPILIVSVVKICKQCLHTASDPLPGLRPSVPLGDFRPPTLLAYSIQMKIPDGTITALRLIVQSRFSSFTLSAPCDGFATERRREIILLT